MSDKFAFYLVSVLLLIFAKYNLQNLIKSNLKSCKKKHTHKKKTKQTNTTNCASKFNEDMN